jgi:tRNA A-37 threonylcarbamoyl transferase component Bud32/tetratricopeptide (TPR) repeat protein
MMESVTQMLPARYREVERIARGAMGDIYRATDSTLGRVVAVKVLAEPYVEDEAARKRFAREAHAAARLSGDPNIVTIYDVGEAAERPYIVMEYMSGGSLEQRLASGMQPPAQAVRWLEQVARALDHAHANGVVHRDVKPANLLLDGENDVHVADFGIATAAWMASLTATGTVLGTAGYLAPEQAAGERATPASDRYALAVVAYELLTGERPFARESPTAEAAAHVSEPVPAVSRRGDLPVTLDAVFERALAKQPEERYATGAEFVAALRGAFGAAAGRTREFTAPPAPAPSRVRRTPPVWPLVAAGVGAVVVVAVVLAVVLAGNSPTTHAVTAPQHKPAARAVAARTPDPHSLNDRARALMKRGRYASALPLLQRAVPSLECAGPADPYEGFANYNLGYTLLQLGRCADALPYLQHARQLEPDRSEVDSALASVQQCLAPTPPKKHHEEKKKHKGH